MDFPRTDRVRRRADFRRIQGKGKKVHTPHFIVMVAARSDEATRLGITVTKKVGKAVQRNRVKRVLREVFRRNRTLFPKGADLVVVAKKGAPDLGYAEALDELKHASAAVQAAARRARPRRRPLDEEGRR